MEKNISASEFQKRYGHLKTLRSCAKTPSQGAKVSKYHNVSGWWTNNVKTHYMHSMLESNFAWFLEFLLEKEKIKEWIYEPKPAFTFPTRANNTYLPDFKVWTENDEIVIYEVKGYLDSRSKIKLNRMAKYYPDIKIQIINSKVMKIIELQFKSLIKNWDKPLLSKEELNGIKEGSEQ